MTDTNGTPKRWQVLVSLRRIKEFDAADESEAVKLALTDALRSLNSGEMRFRADVSEIKVSP